jgi:hypothetical protein
MSAPVDQLRAWPLNGYAPGGYTCKCSTCEKEFIGDKRAVVCLECAVLASKRLNTTLQSSLEAVKAENAELRTQDDPCFTYAFKVRAEAAEARVEELQKDRDRLDFLDACNQRLNASYGTNYRWELILNHNVNRLMLGHLNVDLNDAKAHGWPSCRDAIDREMLRVVAARALSPARTEEGKP